MNRFSGFRSAFLAVVTYLVMHPVLAVEKESWKQDFEHICIQVEAAASLSENELRELISQSEALLERLLEVKDPQARIYRMRLEKCRDFFSFMAAARQQQTSQADAGQ